MANTLYIYTDMGTITFCYDGEEPDLYDAYEMGTLTPYVSVPVPDAVVRAIREHQQNRCI